jgi:hypothetical protein
VLVADTNALKTGSSSNDWTYRLTLGKIKILGAARDAVATRIKNDLFAAEFDNHPIPGANDLKDCQSILALAASLNR